MDDARDPAGGKFRLKARELEGVDEPDTAASETPPLTGGGLDVREMLRVNVERELAKGGYRVKPGGESKLRRRILAYGATLVAVDAPLSFVAWRSGHTDPFAFVFSLAAIAYFTARLTWEAWFLRTD